MVLLLALATLSACACAEQTLEDRVLASVGMADNENLRATMRQVRESVTGAIQYAKAQIESAATAAQATSASGTSAHAPEPAVEEDMIGDSEGIAQEDSVIEEDL